MTRARFDAERGQPVEVVIWWVGRGRRDVLSSRVRSVRARRVVTMIVTMAGGQHEPDDRREGSPLQQAEK